MAGNLTTVRVEGLKELEQALAEFKPATSRAIARRALVKAAQPIADHARELVPVDTGALRDSIRVSTKTSNRAGKAEYAAAMRAGLGKAAASQAMRDARRGANSKSEVTVYVGAGQLPHAHLVEFGSVNNTPHPYLRPAWDAGKQRVVDDIKDQMKVEIDKAAKRAAARARRLLK